MPTPVASDAGHGPSYQHRPARRIAWSSLDLGCRGLDERSAAAVAADLAPGGTLAVLTHSHRAGGRLFDPTGAVIAALQDADLLYLQHIVIVEHPLSPQPEPTHSGHSPTTAADDHRRRRRTRPGRGPGRSHALSPTRFSSATRSRERSYRVARANPPPPAVSAITPRLRSAGAPASSPRRPCLRRCDASLVTAPSGAGERVGYG